MNTRQDPDYPLKRSPSADLRIGVEMHVGITHVCTYHVRHWMFTLKLASTRPLLQIVLTIATSTGTLLKKKRKFSTTRKFLARSRCRFGSSHKKLGLLRCYMHSCTLDLVKKIRQRHLRWLGHLLRVGEHRLTYHSLQVQLQMQRRVDNLFMDDPPFDNLKDLSDLTQDRCKWGIGVVRLTWHYGVNYGLIHLSEKKRNSD